MKGKMDGERANEGGGGLSPHSPPGTLQVTSHSLLVASPSPSLSQSVSVCDPLHIHPPLSATARRRILASSPSHIVACPQGRARTLRQGERHATPRWWTTDPSLLEIFKPRRSTLHLWRWRRCRGSCVACHPQAWLSRVGKKINRLSDGVMNNRALPGGDVGSAGENWSSTMLGMLSSCNKFAPSA
jgi:hypothetical protein